MLNRKNVSAMLLCVMAVTACRDGRIPTDVTPAAPVNRTASAAEPNRIVEPPMLSRFDLEVRADGTFRPNTPIRILATARANLSSPGTEIRISLPEMEAAEQSEYGPGFRVPVGVPLPTRGEWRVNLGRGQRIQQATVVRIPAPGYYRAVATAYYPNAEPAFVDGREVRNFLVREVWLLVDEDGGRVTNDFDPTLLPDSVVAQPGPLRRKAQGRRSAARSGLSSSLAGSQNYQDYYQLLYANTEVPGNTVYIPVPEAEVWVSTMYWDYGDPKVSGGYGLTTDEDGKFAITCTTYVSSAWGDDFYEARIALENGRVRVENSQFTGPSQQSSDCGYTSAVTPSQVIAPSVRARVFREMSITAYQARQFFDQWRGQVYVDIRTTDGSSWYDKYYDEINLYQDDVWTNKGIRVMAHEYGHAYHQQALGGIPNYVNRSCWSHQPYSVEDPYCAYTEGFAHYFAAVIRGVEAERTGNVRVDINTSSYDGSRMEGYVAAFLYDLTDNDDESFDQVFLPGKYLGEIIRTCDVYVNDIVVGFGWERARAVADIIHCLEQQVDPAFANSTRYFTDLPDPSDYREDATEPSGWDRAKIRKLWKAVLYNEI